MESIKFHIFLQALSVDAKKHIQHKSIAPKMLWIRLIPIRRREDRDAH